MRHIRGVCLRVPSRTALGEERTELTEGALCNGLPIARRRYFCNSSSNKESAMSRAARIVATPALRTLRVLFTQKVSDAARRTERCNGHTLQPSRPIPAKSQRCVAESETLQLTHSVRSVTSAL